MKLNVLLALVFLLICDLAHANQSPILLDTMNIPAEDVIDPEIFLENLPTLNKLSEVKDTIYLKPDYQIINKNNSAASSENLPVKQDVNNFISEDAVPLFKLPTNLVPVKIDTLLLMDNPFFIDLVYMGYHQKFNWTYNPDFRLMYYGRPASTLNDALLLPIKMQSAEDIIAELRSNARNEITRKSVNLYIMSFDQLPDPKGNKNIFIEGKPLEKIQFANENKQASPKKLYVKREKLGSWFHKANALAQFSENTVSENWYQGGSNNVAVLGILSGQLNYDNKKNIQWENYGEWRMGFNSVEGDTLRMLSTNDDVFKINSKLGIKAGGNFFYSGSVDFYTQFFQSYKGINSTLLKTAFLTPVRVNIGVGMDYKYKKIFSLMVAPVAFKYIYMRDSVRLNPNLFGIEKGQNQLKEIGSSFKAQFSYPITREIQLDSRLSYYTNYKSVEIDWEIVCNMTINRFLSTRISINPRFDDSVILPNGDTAEWQFKQLISVGFAHRFR